jgi:hypothetical protein
MALFEVIHRHIFESDPSVESALGRIEKLALRILQQGARNMNDLSALNAKMDELASKAVETNKTLADLAQMVVDLKNSSDVQAGIDAVAAKAQEILDGMSAAEDAADDVLPAA